MKKLKKILFFSFLIFTVNFIAFATESKDQTQTPCQILKIKGSALVRLQGKEDWAVANEGMILNQGDIVKTSPNSMLVLEIIGLKSDQGEATTVDIEENSQLLLAQLIKDEKKNTRKTLLDLAIGKILIKTKKIHTAESQFEVKTPTSLVGVRGTTFSVQVEAVE